MQQGRSVPQEPVASRPVSAVLPTVAVRDVYHAYAAPEGEIAVLNGTTFTVDRGEIVAITGTSGSGKTTLLSLLGGLERPQRGTVHVAGRDVGSLDNNALAAFRRSAVGFVFQDFGLLGQLTALENVELALTFGRTSRRRRRARARDVLAAVGLAHRVDHRPNAMSGGENQRVAIARALANQPAVILADEPTGNLDASSTAAVLDLLTGLPHAYQCTLLIVTHDDLVARRADRRLHLVNGRVAEAVQTG